MAESISERIKVLGSSVLGSVILGSGLSVFYSCSRFHDTGFCDSGF